MSIPEFAELIGVPDWSNLTDAKELLKEAAILGHEDTVRMLLHKTNKEIDGDVTAVIEAFHYSCFYGNQWVARLCLDYLPEVDIADVHGRTGLHRAAQQGHEWVVAALLEYGANIDAQDMLGITPLDEALSHNREPIVRVFMRHRGALVASSKPNGERPLIAIRSVREIPSVEQYIGMDATIVEFYVDTSTEGNEIEEHRVERKAVESLIWGDRPSSDSDSRGSAINSEEAYPEPDFKWYHLPANNVSL